jgi:hypothetical protein
VAGVARSEPPEWQLSVGSLRSTTATQMLNLFFRGRLGDTPSVETNDSSKMIPDFRDDGYLPEGLHLATEAEITFRFGTATPRRRRLALRLRRWIELSRTVGAKRLFVDGSFVTAKSDPNDVDAVVWLGDDFVDRVSRGDVEALELEMMLVTRQPEESFAAEDRRDWDDWVEFFSRTREANERRKGVVEVEL